LAPLLASPGNLAAAVGKLAVLEKGEQALRGMPHPEQRTAALKKFRMQVATLLQPQLVQALQSMSTSNSSTTTSTSSSSHHHGNTLGPLQQCVSLYSQLSMLDDLKRQYVNVRPAALHKAWWDYRPSVPTAGGGSQQQQQPALVPWLPTWFEAVLQMLNEERRQAQAVFGQSSQTVPFVMCQVLESTFAPILSSFASRLESLHSTSSSSSTATNSNSKTAESLAWTAAVYESTIQFMSLAYETVAAAWLDLMESESGGRTTTSASNDHRDAGLALYQDLQKLFIKIASPFSPYQKRLAELERETTKHTLQNLSQQIQQLTLPLQSQQQKRGGSEGQPPIKASGTAAATSSKASLESLQKTTDGLLQLISSPRAGMLPHAELTLGRMELLQGGYMTTETLQAIDETLAGHVEELIRAVETLRAASLSNNSAGSTGTVGGGTVAAADENFDEPHVLCALEVLKIAGTCRRQMQRLQDLTRQRVSVLSQRIMEHEVREKELEQLAAAAAAAGGGGMSSTSSGSGKRNPFLLPDALSIVDISSIITRAVLCTNKGDTATALAFLHKLAAASISSTDEEKEDAASVLVRLYPQADAAAKRLAHSCHTFVFDVCSAVPRRHLAGMSSMSAWKEASLSTGQDNLASYGTLPQSYITHVGEHMLALVQALEPFASDREALALANEVMDGVREVAVQPWLDLSTACGALRGSSNEQQFIYKFMAGKDFADLVMGNVVMEEEDDNEDDAGQDDDGGEVSKASAAFCNAWLDVVGLAVTGRLLERIMRIPSLTAKGCEHLNADLNYLVNVFAALGVAGHPHPLLGHLSEIVLLDGPTLTQRISTSTVEGGDPSSVVEAAAFLRSMEERLAAMRGEN
jgi:conserved oligomeric Golgi complex subunit 7